MAEELTSNIAADAFKAYAGPKDSTYATSELLKLLNLQLAQEEADRQRKSRAEPTTLNHTQLTTNRLPYLEKAQKASQTEELKQLIGNTTIFGHSNAGKTNFVCKMLYFNKVEPFDIFVYVKHTSEAQTTNNIEKVREASVSNMILFGNKEDTEANESYLFFRDFQVEEAIRFCESDVARGKKKLIFFDDIQVGSDMNGARRNMSNITNFMGRCKHADTTVILAIHKNFDDTKDARGEAINMIAMNLNEKDFNFLFGLKAGNEIYKVNSAKNNKFDRVVIFTSGDKKYYNGNFRTLIPLIPQPQEQPPQPMQTEEKKA